VSSSSYHASIQRAVIVEHAVSVLPDLVPRLVDQDARPELLLWNAVTSCAEVEDLFARKSSASFHLKAITSTIIITSTTVVVTLHITNA